MAELSVTISKSFPFIWSAQVSTPVTMARGCSLSVPLDLGLLPWSWLCCQQLFTQELRDHQAIDEGAENQDGGEQLQFLPQLCPCPNIRREALWLSLYGKTMPLWVLGTSGQPWPTPDSHARGAACVVGTHFALLRP